MFINSIKALTSGDELFLYKFFIELESMDVRVDDVPDAYDREAVIKYIINTNWYKNGGWKAIRQAAYGSWEKQLEMQYDGVWTSHVLYVKNTFPKY